MGTIVVNNSTSALALEIFQKSKGQVSSYPVDRDFVERYMDEISIVEPIEFIFENFELFPTNWSVNLFLCLPEVWLGIGVDEIICLIENFKNSYSFCSLILFTYKFIEIDIIEIILKDPYVKKNFKKDIMIFLHLQWHTIMPTQLDRELLNNNKHLGSCMAIWQEIRLKLLLDQRVKVSLNNSVDLQAYFMKLGEKKRWWLI